MSRLREIILNLSIAILIAVAAGEFGFIMGKWKEFDYPGRLINHETKIKMLESEMKQVRDKLRMP